MDKIIIKKADSEAEEWKSDIMELWTRMQEVLHPYHDPSITMNDYKDDYIYYSVYKNDHKDKIDNFIYVEPIIDILKNYGLTPTAVVKLYDLLLEDADEHGTFKKADNLYVMYPEMPDAKPDIEDSDIKNKFKRKKRRFRNEPDGWEEQMQEGMDGYKNQFKGMGTENSFDIGFTDTGW